jgi:hypothetical protein
MKWTVTVPDVTYYALIDENRPLERPKGLVRRIHTEPLPTDEVFGRDLQWHPTEYLRLYYLGHNEVDHVEISEEQAEAIIAARRERQARKSGEGSG